MLKHRVGLLILLSDTHGLLHELADLELFVEFSDDLSSLEVKGITFTNRAVDLKRRAEEEFLLIRLAVHGICPVKGCDKKITFTQDCYWRCPKDASHFSLLDKEYEARYAETRQSDKGESGKPTAR